MWEIGNFQSTPRCHKHEMREGEAAKPEDQGTTKYTYY
jgi:hypothetical protein